MPATAQTFPPEHYDTAEHYGFPNFSDAWSETTAELNLTLQALMRAGLADLFRREDLIGYHFLHYGSDSEVTGEVIDMVDRWWSDDSTWASPLKTLLPEMIGEKTIRNPELGRIALGREAVVASELTDVLERVEIKSGPENGYEGAKRFGNFLYPPEGVAMYYLGRNSLDLADDRLTFHVDRFTVDFDDEVETYNALSYDKKGGSYLAEIALASSSVS